MIWGAAAINRLPSAFWRRPRTLLWRAIAAGGWLAGAIAATLIVRVIGPAIPIGPMWVALLFAGASAAALARVEGRIRRVSQSARLAIFFVALLGPAVAMYPSLLAHATEAKERLVAEAFGPQALSLREDLQQRLQQAVEQIDADPRARRSVPAGRRHTGDQSRVRRVVAHRSCDLPVDVGGRAVRPRRHAAEPRSR